MIDLIEKMGNYEAIFGRPVLVKRIITVSGLHSNTTTVVVCWMEASLMGWDGDNPIIRHNDGGKEVFKKEDVLEFNAVRRGE